MGARKEDEPTFVASAVCAATGVPRGTLNWWATHGVLRNLSPTVPGKARRFTVKDAFVIAVLKELTDFGIAPEQASERATKAIDHWASSAVNEKGKVHR